MAEYKLIDRMLRGKERLTERRTGTTTRRRFVPVQDRKECGKTVDSRLARIKNRQQAPKRDCIRKVDDFFLTYCQDTMTMVMMILVQNNDAVRRWFLQDT